MEILMNVTEKERFHVEALSPFPELMSESSALLRAFPQKGIGLWEEGEGPRGEGKQWWKTLKTNSECFGILAAVLTAHAQSLIARGVCSD